MKEFTTPIYWEKFTKKKLYDRKDDFMVLCTDGEQLFIQVSWYDDEFGWDIEKYDKYFDHQKGWVIDEDSTPCKVLYFAEMPFPNGERLEALK